MMSLRNRRLATLALLGAAIGVTPVAGSGWLRGGSREIEESSQTHRQELSLFNLIARENPSTSSPTQSTNSTESNSTDLLRIHYASTVAPTSTPPSTISNSSAVNSTESSTTSPTVGITQSPSVSPSVGATGSPTPSPTVGATESSTTLSLTTTPSVASEPPIESSTVSPTIAKNDAPSQAPTIVSSDGPSTVPTVAATTKTTTSPTKSSSTALLTLDSSPEEPGETTKAEEAEEDVSTETATTPEETSTTSVTANDQAPEAPEETDTMEEAEDEDIVTEPPKPPTKAPTASPTTAKPTVAPTPKPTTEVEESVTALVEAVKNEVEGGDGLKYSDESWDNLPMDAKAAAMTLGFDRVTWDFRQPVFSDHILWADLEPEQSMAATILGFDEKSWDAKHVPAPEPLEASVYDDGNAFSNAWTGNSEGDSITKDIANDSFQGTVEGEEEPVPSEAQIAEVLKPDYWSYDWADLPDLQKEAATLLGYERTSWNNDEDVVTSFLTWNQMSFDLRQAAKTLGLRAQSWNMAVAAREPPAEDSAPEQTSTSFYANSPADESTAEDGKGKEAESKDPKVIDISRGWVGRKKADDEEKPEKIVPALEEIEKEVGSLKVELADAREKIQKHEQVLGVLQKMDPDETIGSVGDLIKLGRKKKGGGNGRRKKKNGRKKALERVEPVVPAPKGDDSNARTIANDQKRKNKKNLLHAPPPVSSTRTFFGGDEESEESADSDEDTAPTWSRGYDGGGSSSMAWARHRGGQ